MARGRPLPELTLSPSERSELVSITRSRSLPHALVTRGRIVLLSADGLANTAIAEQLGLSKPTVGMWRQRYLLQRVQGLYDELRPGGPRSIRDEEIAVLIRKTLKTKPKDGTHWTCRSIAGEGRLSKSTVQRVWKAFGLQPHRQKHFKISTDPFFVEKVRDVVGLYLAPPDRALPEVLAHDPAGPELDAPVRVVHELPLVDPVHLGRAHVQAGLRVARPADVRGDNDEGLLVGLELVEGEALVHGEGPVRVRLRRLRHLES